MKKLWIARDKTTEIFLSIDRPRLGVNKQAYFPTKGGYMQLPIDCFPEVAFESGPVEVELIIKKK
jgi:hypothetical protein